MSEDLRLGEDGLRRCGWCGADPQYVAYHDEEWGRPVGSDQRLFEKLCLEGFQSGLSWLTILRKRDAFRRAFQDFDIAAVARFGEADVTRLLGDAGIVRHHGKIEATIGNARAAADIIDPEGSLGALIWRYEPDTPPPPLRSMAEAQAKTKESTALAKDLKARGFRFFGPTTAYAFMQSMGLVNDHLEGCAFRDACEADRAAFTRPS